MIDAVWPDSGGDLGDDEITELIAASRGAGPWVSANFVSSVDGAVTRDGKSGDLGGPADKRLFDLLRRPSDAVLVGAGTVRAEGYGPLVLDAASAAWRVANGFEAQPVFAIVSGSLDLDPGSRIFTEAPVRPVVVTIGDADAGRRAALEQVADVLIAGDSELDAHAMIDGLVQRGLARVHNEGGPRLFGTLLAADLIDELSLTVSPTLEGGAAGRIASGDLPVARQLELAGILRSEHTVFLRYQRGGSVDAD